MLVMGGLGWRQGGVKLLASLGILLVSGLVAQPLAPMAVWFVKALGAPRLLHQPLAALVAGITFFVILLIPTNLAIAKYWGKVGEERPSWDGPVGGTAGALWGLILVLLTVTGLSSVARLDRAMRQGTAEAELRAGARQRFERQADEELRPLRRTMSPKRYQEEKTALVAKAEEEFRVDPGELKKAMPEGPLDGLLIDLEHSPYEKVIDRASPVNERLEEALRDLTIVMGDSMLMARFLEEPVVKDLVRDPALKALSSDPEVEAAIRESRYRDLLDHPKVLALMEDPQLKAKLAKVDMPKILKQVRSHEWKPPVEGSTF